MSFIEITRNNITEAQFRANCRQALKNTSLSGWMDYISADMHNMDGTRTTRSISDEAGNEHDYDEVCCQRVGDVQYYCRGRDGHGYNFIWEWSPWMDEKLGTGYFYCAEF